MKLSVSLSLMLALAGIDQVRVASGLDIVCCPDPLLDVVLFELERGESSRGDRGSFSAILYRGMSSDLSACFGPLRGKPPVDCTPNLWRSA